jgi:hypothetical protein
MIHTCVVLYVHFELAFPSVFLEEELFAFEENPRNAGLMLHEKGVGI